jgi:hypothetical protein
MSAPVVPEDFPRGGALGAVPGAQPKLLVREVACRFVRAMPTDAEVHGRYEVCEDLVQQLLRYSARKRSEFPDWTPSHVREKVDVSVRQKACGWGLTQSETEWILRRFAAEI